MILILATGRCGSRETARILHNLGVNMGKTFYKDYKALLTGPVPIFDNFFDSCTMEDSEFIDLNLRYVTMGLETITHELPWDLWRVEFKKVIDKRKEPWGLLDPGITGYPKLLQEYLNLKPRIIRCKRNKKDTTNDFIKTYGLSKEKALKIINNRLKNLSKVKEDLTIDCYETVENKEKKLKQWITKEII